MHELYRQIREGWATPLITAFFEVPRARRAGSIDPMARPRLVRSARPDHLRPKLNDTKQECDPENARFVRQAERY
jgi:hypothetical protein